MKLPGSFKPGVYRLITGVYRLIKDCLQAKWENSSPEGRRSFIRISGMVRYIYRIIINGGTQGKRSGCNSESLGKHIGLGRGGLADNRMGPLPFHRLQLRSRRIGDTQHFERIIEHPALDILIIGILYFDAPIDTLPLIGWIIIRQPGDLDLERDKLGFIILVAVQPGFQVLIRAALYGGNK